MRRAFWIGPFAFVALLGIGIGRAAMGGGGVRTAPPIHDDGEVTDVDPLRPGTVGCSDITEAQRSPMATAKRQETIAHLQRRGELEEALLAESELLREIQRRNSMLVQMGYREAPPPDPADQLLAELQRVQRCVDGRD